MATRVDYHEYLASREWRLKRKEVIDLEDGLCARCKSAPIQSVHHLTYETLGNEDSWYDLLGVCANCHQYLAGETDEDPALPLIHKLIEKEGLHPADHPDGWLLWLTVGNLPNGDCLYIAMKRTEDLSRRDKAHVCLPFGTGIIGVCFWM